MKCKNLKKKKKRKPFKISEIIFYHFQVIESTCIYRTVK